MLRANLSTGFEEQTSNAGRSPAAPLAQGAVPDLCSSPTAPLPEKSQRVVGMVWEGERTADHISACPTGSTAAGHPAISPQPPKIAPRVVHAASNTAPNTPNNRIFPIAFRVVTAPRCKRAAQRALSARAARGWVCKLQLPPRRLLGAGSRAFGQNPPAARSREGMQAAAVRRGRARWCCGAALRARTAPAAGTLRHAPSTWYRAWFV